MELTSRYDFALALVQEAGALALGYFRDLGSLTIKSKGLQDMASEADVRHGHAPELTVMRFVERFGGGLGPMIAALAFVRSIPSMLSPKGWLAVALLAAFLLFGAYCAHKAAEGERDR